jgi:hypothetical protein
VARKKLVDKTVLEPVEPKLRPEPDGTDWKRAFLVLVAFLSNGFYSTKDLSKMTQAVYDEAGDEAGDLMTAAINKYRSTIVHSLMG